MVHIDFFESLDTHSMLMTLVAAQL